MDSRIPIAFTILAFVHAGCAQSSAVRQTASYRPAVPPPLAEVRTSRPATAHRVGSARDRAPRNDSSGEAIAAAKMRFAPEPAPRLAGTTRDSPPTAKPGVPTDNSARPESSKSRDVLLASGEAPKLTVPTTDPKSSDLGKPPELAPAPSSRPISLSDKSYTPAPRTTTSLLPIDLPTVIRLVNANSPLVGFSQARAREAYARAEAADLLWLPNLTVGSAYNRFDGQTQNQAGNIFSVSRSNLFLNGGVGLNLDTSDAFYRPLIEHRSASAENRRAAANSIVAELEATLAYYDLLQAHELLVVNASSLERGESLLEAARNAQQAKADRSPGDVHRVRTEVLLRRQERYDIESRCASASARLARLVLVDPRVRLVPQVSEAVPVMLVDPHLPAEELLTLASYNRQELGASADQIAAAWERVKRAKYGPLFPKLQVTDQAGSFGGGTNSDMQDFRARNTVGALMYWELKNLGFGNRSEVRERSANLDQAHFQQLEAQARVAAEVIEAAEVALAKSEALSVAREAVSEAEEVYRINREGTFNVVDSKNLFDALRPLQAIQILHQARQSYVAAVLDYSRSQYRLHAALGRPGMLATPGTPASLPIPTGE